MVSLDQLLNFSGDTLGATTSAWHDAADALAQHSSLLGSQVREGLDRGVWSGQAGDAARGHLDGLLSKHADDEQRLRSVAGALENANGGLTAARSALGQALEVARQAGLDVGKDGSVSWNLARTIDLLTNPTGLVTIGRLAGDVAGLIGQALDHASTVDSHTARTLGTLAPGASPAPQATGAAGNSTPTTAALAQQEAQQLREQVREGFLSQDLLNDIKKHENDPVYAEEFLNAYGAQNLAKLADECGECFNGVPEVLQDLGTMLALATSDDTANPLPESFVDDFLSADQDTGPTGGRPEYYTTCELLRFGKYGTAFLDKVSGPIYTQAQYDDQNLINEPLSSVTPLRDPLDPNDHVGSDRLSGLFTALSRNASASQDFFESDNSRMSYLLQRYHNLENGQQGGRLSLDGGDSFGKALMSATITERGDGSSSQNWVSADLTSKLVHDISVAKQLPDGARQDVAHILGNYYPDVRQAMLDNEPGPDGSPIRQANLPEYVDPKTGQVVPQPIGVYFKPNELADTMKQVFTDPKAFQIVYQAKQDTDHLIMAADLAKAEPGSPGYDNGKSLQTVMEQSGQESRTLLDLSHQADYSQYMNAEQEAQAQNQSRQLAEQIAGGVVNLALSPNSWAQSIAGLGMTAVYQAIPPVDAPTDPTPKDVTDQNAAYYNDVDSMAINLNNNGVLGTGSDAAAYCANHPDAAPFVDSSGKIISPAKMNSDQWHAFKEWMADPNSGATALNPYLNQYDIGFGKPLTMGGDTAV